VAIVIAIVWYLIGVHFLTGLGLLFLIIPIQAIIANAYKNYKYNFLIS
jgi:hypothetical protein